MKIFETPHCTKIRENDVPLGLGLIIFRINMVADSKVKKCMLKTHPDRSPTWSEPQTLGKSWKICWQINPKSDPLNQKNLQKTGGSHENRLVFNYHTLANIDHWIPSNPHNKVVTVPVPASSFETSLIHKTPGLGILEKLNLSYHVGVTSVYS